MMEVFNLRDDPFRERHDHEIVGEERIETVKKIVDLIEYNATTDKQEGDRILAIVQGTYGLGKTFTLRYLQNNVLLDPKGFAKFSTRKNNLKVAVSRFRLLDQGKLENKIILALYRKILLNLEKDDGGLDFFKKLLKTAEKTAKNRKKDIKDLLSVLKKPFRDVFLQLGDVDKEFIAWEWISGGKLTSKDMNAIGVQFKIDSDRLAEIYLIEFLKLLRICGYNSLVVLADEAEDAINTPPAKLTQLLIALRNIYDTIGERFSNKEPIISLIYISSFSPETWEVINDTIEKQDTKSGGAGLRPFMERLWKNIFSLSQFTDEDSINLVKVLLNKYRTKKLKDPLYPFDKEAITEIRDLANGIPRKIMRLCSQCLQRAEKTKAKINKEFVLNVFQEEGIIDRAEAIGDIDEGYEREI